MTSALASVSQRLCELSRTQFTETCADMQWPESVDEDDWFFSPELMSGWDTAVVEGLDEAGLRRLSLLEALNFFSLNIHGEKMLLQGVADRLYRERFRDLTTYLQHFIDEENRHLYWFGEFCRRYGRIYPCRHVMLPAEPLPPTAEDFLFFARILVFEDIVDGYNARMASDARLEPLAREINRMHHEDEVRHRAFGRHLLRQSWREGTARWSAAVTAAVRQRLRDYLCFVWRDYYNPEVYRDAGLADPHRMTQLAWTSAAGRRRRERMTAPTMAFFNRIGVLAEEGRS